MHSPNRIVATLFGVVYLFVGLLGFSATDGVDYFGTNGGLLIGVFEVNPFHNTAHALIGIVLLLGGISGVQAAKVVNVTIGGAYLLLGVVGFFLVGTELNVLALNAPDHFLHLGSAILLLATGLGAERGAMRESEVG